MQRQTRLFIGALAFVGTSLPAIADVDRLPADRMDSIKAAYAAVLADPAMNVDRLNKARMTAVAMAYESHPAPMPVDTLPAARWTEMQAAYQRLKPGYDALALAD